MWRVGGIPDSGCWVSGSSAASRFLRREGRYTRGSTSSPWPWPRRDLWPSQRDSHGSAASVRHAERSGRHAPARVTLLSRADLLTGELLHSAAAPRRFLPRRLQTGAGPQHTRVFTGRAGRHERKPKPPGVEHFSLIMIIERGFVLLLLLFIYFSLILNLVSLDVLK